VIVGIGVDIVDIGRIRQVLERQAERFVRRVYTAAEQALFKAVGTGWAHGVTWLDAEVRRQESGAPRLTLSGRAEEISKALGTHAIHLSLSHSETAAIAIVILER
jgi:holo-[acyl-carrier protein] synthase